MYYTQKSRKWIPEKRYTQIATFGGSPYATTDSCLKEMIEAGLTIVPTAD